MSAKGFTEEEYGDLRKSIIEEERSHPTVAKKYKEVAALREEVNPLIPLKASISAARRLDSNLRSLSDVPDIYFQQVGVLIAHLDAELEAMSAAVSGGEAGNVREI